MTLKVGDSVAVKSSILDPDFGTDISGWQGRIEENNDGETVFIRLKIEMIDDPRLIAEQGR